MRQHGQAVTYRFGIDGGSDSSKGCRCTECSLAVAEYEKRRRQRVEPAYVGADGVRKHLEFLASQGVGLKQVAKVSGVSQGALWKLMYGKRQPDGSQKPSKRVRPETASKILAVMPSDGAGGSRVPARPVWEDVRTLLGRGWTKQAIARAIGQTAGGLQLGHQVVTRRNAEAIHELLDQPVPDDVGLAWSSRYRSQASTTEVVDLQPRALDDVDELVLEVAKILEERIDQNHWRRRAACLGKPTWMFFPGRGDAKVVAAAKAVCQTCPVAAECLAAHDAERDGIFGGLTARNRQHARAAEREAS